MIGIAVMIAPATIYPMAELTVRIPDDLHAQVREAAQEDRRSVNAEILWLIEQGLAAREG
jgi:predicted HicB family RNase H-like nuclease